MAVPINKDFGPELRRLRQKKGISIREVARRIGISSSYLSAVERAMVPAPELETIGKLCGAMDIKFYEAIELDALSGRFPGDLHHALQSRPLEWTAIVRFGAVLKDADLAELVKLVERFVKEREGRPDVDEQQYELAIEAMNRFHALRE